MKKILSLLAVILISTAVANAGVPIFSSDSTNEVKIKPTEQRNIFTENIHNTGTTQETYITATTKQPYGSIQNNGYKSAISSLDSAQAEIRDNLVEIKAEYTEVKAKYETTKAKYKSLKKQIRDSENKIKKIERTKKNIAKNMIQDI